MIHLDKARGLFALLGISLAAATAGCVGEPEIDTSGWISQSRARPLVWTGKTSEESPPLECPANTSVHGVECFGNNCDDIRLDCAATSGTYGSSSWTAWFSEEDSAHFCGTNEWMTGIACRGNNCDDISLRCTAVAGKTQTSCSWSGWYSEEDGPYQAGTNRFIRGVECRGNNCDDMRYSVCTMSTP